MINPALETNCNIVSYTSYVYHTAVYWRYDASTGSDFALAVWHVVGPWSKFFTPGSVASMVRTHADLPESVDWRKHTPSVVSPVKSILVASLGGIGGMLQMGCCHPHDGMGMGRWWRKEGQQDRWLDEWKVAWKMLGTWVVGWLRNRWIHGKDRSGRIWWGGYVNGIKSLRHIKASHSAILSIQYLHWILFSSN